MTCHGIRPNVCHIGILHLVSISTHHRRRHAILHHSAKFYPNRTTLSRKNDVMSIFKIVYSCTVHMYMFVCLFFFLIYNFFARRPAMLGLIGYSVSLPLCVTIIDIIYVRSLIGRIKMLACLLVVSASTSYYGRPLSVSGRPCYILPMLFIYLFIFMAALFSGPG